MGGTEQSSRLSAAVIVACAIVVCLPLIAVPIPPLLDYPNHYARLWLLAGGIRDPALSAMYGLGWKITWFNVFIDMVAASVGPLFGIRTVHYLVLAIALLTPPVGLALLQRSLFGSFSWWNALCFVLCWNWIFLAGFLNFETSLGLALLAASLETRVTGLPLIAGLAIRLVAALAVIIAHPFGGLFYAGLIFSIAWGPTLRVGNLRGTAVHAVVAGLRALPAMAAIIAIAAASPRLPGTSHIGATWAAIDIKSVVSVLTTYFRGYDFVLDSIVIVAGADVIALAVRWQCLKIHGGLLILSAFLAIASPAIPISMMGTSNIQKRLPSMMALALVAGLRPELQLVVGSRALVLLAVGAVSLRTATIMRTWWPASSDIASVEAASRSVEPGSAILPVDNQIDPASAPSGRYLFRYHPIYWHYPTLAVVERKAFIPLLFAEAGKQPLRILPPLDAISTQERAPPTVGELLAPREPWIRDWCRRFDYVLLMNADRPTIGWQIADLPQLSLVQDQGFARLYRIEKPATAGCAGQNTEQPASDLQQQSKM